MASEFSIALRLLRLEAKPCISILDKKQRYRVLLPSRRLAILLNILKCLLVFYSTYYIISSLCSAGYRLKDFDGRIPFDFKSWLHLERCCYEYSTKETVYFLSQMLSFASSGLVLGVVVRERVWDYSLTVTVIHTALACLVMLSFPLNWSWWVCLALAALLMIMLGELMALALRLKYWGKVAPEPALGTDGNSFLHRKT